MFVDPIIMQFPENLDSENFVIATYYCATKPTTNMVKFAAALAIEQTCGTWLKVPGETPEVRERAIGRVVGVYEAPSYQIGIPADVTERHFIVRIAYPWHNFGAQFSMMLSTVIGNISSSGKVKLIDLEFPKSFLAEMKGPKFGVPGIRELLGVYDRPLLNNMIKPLNITNGAKGIANIPKPVLFGKTLDSVTYMYFIVLLLAAAVILICHRLENSKLGRAWTAIREDETAARAVGIPIVKMKIASFVISACFGGVMGVVFAAKQGFVSPESFTVQISFMVLAMVILGGTGNIPGVIMGASLISILNLQILKAFSEVLSSARVNGGLNIPEQLDPSKREKIFFGLILIIMMIFRPGGILPTKKKPVTLQSAAAHGEEAEP